MQDTLRKQLTAIAESHGIPGMAIAAVSGDKSAVLTWGHLSKDKERPVTPHTWFSVASLGKHVTAVAILELAHRGLVDLDEPIGQYLTDIPASWADRRINSLLRHTSGLPEYLSHTPVISVPGRRDAFMKTYGDLQPVFTQDTGWVYTNTNYILLGFLIAQQAGVSYSEALHELFRRMGCDGVAVASPDWTRKANDATSEPGSYDEASAQREVIGDGDISFTVEGALNWLYLILGDRLLTPSDKRAAFSPAILESGRPAPYGFGWFLDQLDSRPICSHGGHFDGWTAMAYLNPGAMAGVMVMCNLAPGNTRAVRYLAQVALEGFAPGSTPLSLHALVDDAPGLTETARKQLLRNGNTLDLSCFADELKPVIKHGDPVRNVINLWAGVDPKMFELVEQRIASTHTDRRYRLTYENRVEHLLVGTTPDRQIYWAWPL